jgi:hypothetical protein
MCTVLAVTAHISYESAHASQLDLFRASKQGCHHTTMRQKRLVYLLPSGDSGDSGAGNIGCKPHLAAAYQLVGRHVSSTPIHPVVHVAFEPSTTGHVRFNPCAVIETTACILAVLMYYPAASACLMQWHASLSLSLPDRIVLAPFLALRGATASQSKLTSHPGRRWLGSSWLYTGYGAGTFSIMLQSAMPSCRTRAPRARQATIACFPRYMIDNSKTCWKSWPDQSPLLMVHLVRLYE